MNPRHWLLLPAVLLVACVDTSPTRMISDYVLLGAKAAPQFLASDADKMIIVDDPDLELRLRRIGLVEALVYGEPVPRETVLSQLKQQAASIGATHLSELTYQHFEYQGSAVHAYAWAWAPARER